MVLLRDEVAGGFGEEEGEDEGDSYGDEGDGLHETVLDARWGEVQFSAVVDEEACSRQYMLCDTVFWCILTHCENQQQNHHVATNHETSRACRRCVWLAGYTPMLR